MWLIFALLCIIPMICHRKSFQSNNINVESLNTLLEDTIEGLTQCERKSILKLGNHMFIAISIGLCIVFYVLMKLGQSCQCGKRSCNSLMNDSMCSISLGNCLPRLEPFTITNRYEIAALIGIVMTEVFTALEHFLTDITDLWNQGVLMQFWDRTFIPLFYRSVSLFVLAFHSSLNII